MIGINVTKTFESLTEGLCMRQPSPPNQQELEGLCQVHGIHLGSSVLFVLTAVPVREQPRQSTFIGTIRVEPCRSIELVVWMFPVAGK